jgi:hypothetical protein
MLNQIQLEAGQERIETLLALGIAFGAKLKSATTEAESNEQLEPFNSNKILGFFSSLPESDRNLIAEKLRLFESLTEEEREIWETNALGRVVRKSTWLDKDVHYTQIAEVLRHEPEIVQHIVLEHLPETLVESVATSLGILHLLPEHDATELTHQTGPLPVVQDTPEETVLDVIRQSFLSSFVSRHELFYARPLEHLSGTDLLRLIQTLGIREVAIACRAIGDIESLAPFLRRFEANEAQAIVEEMSNLKTLEKTRVEKAELLLQETWSPVIGSTAILDKIGLFKLSQVLAASEPKMRRYTTQKLPVTIENKICDIIGQTQHILPETEWSKLCESEVETIAAQIMLDNLQGKN